MGPEELIHGKNLEQNPGTEIFGNCELLCYSDHSPSTQFQNRSINDHPYKRFSISKLTGSLLIIPRMVLLRKKHPLLPSDTSGPN